MECPIAQGDFCEVGGRPSYYEYYFYLSERWPDCQQLRETHQRLAILTSDWETYLNRLRHFTLRDLVSIERSSPRTAFEQLHKALENAFTPKELDVLTTLPAFWHRRLPSGQAKVLFLTQRFCASRPSLLSIS